MDAVILFQLGEDLVLTVIGPPIAHPLGQSGRGQPRFNAQVQLQGMNGTAPWPEGFIEAPPKLHRAKKRGDGVGMLATATVAPSLELDPSGSFLIHCGFQPIQRPGHDLPAHPAQERAELAFKRHHLLRRGHLVDKLINQPHPTRERPRELLDQRLKSGCQQDLGWHRMDHRWSSFFR